MSHFQQRQNAMRSLQDDGLYVNGKQEHGSTQNKGFGGRQRKKSKSREYKKTMQAAMRKRFTLNGEIVGIQVWGEVPHLVKMKKLNSI